MLDNVQVVADEEHRKAAFLLQTVQGEEDLHLYRRIQSGDNFVTDEQIGVRKDSARDAYTLALAAGKLMGVAGEKILRQAHGLERLPDALFRMRL